MKAAARAKGPVMKDYLLPFVAVFAVCAVAFLGLDVAIMALQGLSLIFQP